MRTSNRGDHFQDRLRQECAIFNEAVKVGDMVTYRQDSGELFHTRTRSAAYVMSGHTAVVFVEGLPACVLLARVKKDELGAV